MVGLTEPLIETNERRWVMGCIFFFQVSGTCSIRVQGRQQGNGVYASRSRGGGGQDEEASIAIALTVLGSGGATKLSSGVTCGQDQNIPCQMNKYLVFSPTIPCPLRFCSNFGQPWPLVQKFGVSSYFG